MANRRVVITGMATINPLGDTLSAYIDNLLAGRSGIVRWKTRDVSELQCKVGGDLGDYDVFGGFAKYRDDFSLDKYNKVVSLLRKTTFSSQMGILVACGAWKDAKLFGDKTINRDEIPLIVAGHNLNSCYHYNHAINLERNPNAQFPEQSGFQSPDSGHCGTCFRDIANSRPGR